MPWDCNKATEYLEEVCGKCGLVSGHEFPQGAPLQDYIRSPVAYRIGELAQDAGLFLFHYEKRAPLEIPEHWLGGAHQADVAVPCWKDGTLIERKYQNFRHDLALGSFHPGHRSKWTTHELCHGLVGFAWRESEDLLFHGTAARLAELLPVVVYYFLDEIHLQRCPSHEQSGVLFRKYCPLCEQVASMGPKHESATSVGKKLAQARNFFEAEIQAARDTQHTGEFVAMQWGDIDLCSDGLAYAKAHLGRLNSAAFHRFSEQFLVPEMGYWRSLEDLIDRVVAVGKAIVEGSSLAGFADSVVSKRVSWATQDLAWRILQTWENTEGDAQQALSKLLDEFSRGLQGEGRQIMAPASEEQDFVDQVIKDYLEIYQEFILPSPKSLFSVGYPIGSGWGYSTEFMAEGVASGAPRSFKLVCGEQLALWDAFVLQDHPVRRPIVERWASWLGEQHPGSLAELATFEWQLIRGHTPSAPMSSARVTESEGWVLSPHGKTVLFDVDVAALAQWTDEGTATLQMDATGHLNIMAKGLPWPQQPTGMLFLDAHETQREAWVISPSTVLRIQTGTLLSRQEMETYNLLSLIDEGAFVLVGDSTFEDCPKTSL